MNFRGIINATLGRFIAPNPAADPPSPVSGELWVRANKLWARLNGVTRSVVTSADTGVANGVATLDGSGKVPAGQLPASVSTPAITGLTTTETDTTKELHPDGAGGVQWTARAFVPSGLLSVLSQTAQNVSATGGATTEATEFQISDGTTALEFNTFTAFPDALTAATVSGFLLRDAGTYRYYYLLNSFLSYTAGVVSQISLFYEDRQSKTVVTQVVTANNAYITFLQFGSALIEVKCRVTAGNVYVRFRCTGTGASIAQVDFVHCRYGYLARG